MCPLPAVHSSSYATLMSKPLPQQESPLYAGIFTKVDRAENHKAIRQRIDGSDPNEFRPRLGVKAVRGAA